MKLLMIGGDVSILQAKKGAFWYTLEELRTHFERIDVLCHQTSVDSSFLYNQGYQVFDNVYFHPSNTHKILQPKWIVKKGEELIKAHGHSVMSVHAYPPFLHVIGANWLRNTTAVPYMLEVHGLHGYPKITSLTDSIGRCIVRMFLPTLVAHANTTRVISMNMYNQLKGWGVQTQQMQIIPSFYLDKRFWFYDNSVKKEYDFVFCGRLDKNKGLAGVIKAVAAISGATLLIIGDGKQMKYCKELVRILQVEDRVTFVGWTTEQKEIADYYRKSKVFVLNSRSEGGPRVSLEAMACGLPCISTPVGVMPQILSEGESGLFTDGTVKNIESKMRLLLEDDQRITAMGLLAAESLREYDRSSLIRTYAEALQNLAT